MVEFLLLAGCIGIVLFGFWIMHRIDGLADGKTLHPYWDEADEDMD